MLDIVKRFFNKAAAEFPRETHPNAAYNTQVAVCALFVELARIDEKFSAEEMQAILAILKEKYGLSPGHADDLIVEAEKELEESVDLWQFAKLINENYSNAEKIEIIEMLWRIVYVDGKMDGYEHYLMDKLQNLLRLSHDQLIAAKLKVLHPEKQGRL
jgi:uncharacterized tellurite resistance protein B-like protein